MRITWYSALCGFVRSSRFELPLHLLACTILQLQRRRCGSRSSSHLLPVAILAQLALDRLQLLTQEHLALPLAQLLLHLLLDVLLRLHQRQLPLHQHQQRPEPLLHRQRFQ